MPAGLPEDARQDAGYQSSRKGIVSSAPSESQVTSGPLTLRNSPPEHRAAEPNVGPWQNGVSWNPDLWDFRPAGTFRIKIVEEARKGTFGRDGGSMRIQWDFPRGLPGEKWKVRREDHHLFITTGDVTTEYEHAPSRP